MKKVLVVEDDAFIRDISTIKLTQHGYEVVAVVNGSDALKAFTEHSFSVMLLDVELPDMSGIEILKHVRAQESLKTLPVIVFSNRSEDSIKESFSKLEVLGYFVKASTEYDELFALIDNLRS